VISWEAIVSQGWERIARDDKLYSMASCVSVFDAVIPPHYKYQSFPSKTSIRNFRYYPDIFLYFSGGIN